MMELSLLTHDTPKATLEEEIEAYKIDERLMRKEACPCGLPLSECGRARSGKFDSIWAN